ncbi:MAG: proline dehydrogenase family protein [Chloroflexota bacterium]
MPSSPVHDIPERALRSLLLGLSHQRALGRAAVRVPLTRPMVGRFVAGQTLGEALDAIDLIQAAGYRSAVDVLGESIDSPEMAAAAADRYLETMDAIAARWGDGYVSLKLTQMGLDIGHDEVRANLGRVLRKAEELGVFVRIDMEDHSKTEATLALWRELRPLHRQTGVVIQAALRRSPADIEAIIAERGRVRLCKGAYNEPASVAYPDKADVDAAFATLTERLLLDGEQPAIATHDPALIRHAIRFARAERIDRDRFEFQMLYGVRRDLQERLLRAGYRMRVYVPFGSEWYPYFMRRLAERPANVLFMARALVREGFGRGGQGAAGTG